MTTSQYQGDFQRAKWTSQSAFIFASIGCAVGLGNLWRFPYITGENGGGAFILIYLACIALFAAPLVMAELTIGRLGGRSPIGTMRKLIAENGFGRGWMSIGWLAVILPAIGLSFYSVVAGWSVAYMIKAFSGEFHNITGEQSGAMFGGLTGNAGLSLFWHAFFMIVTTFIIARGLHRGLERAVKIMLPALFVSLVVLVGYAMATADFAGGLKFMFSADFSKVTGETFLMALGQAFFSVAVGVGGMLTYGAYLPSQISIPRAALIITGADTLVAILAGLAIFPILFTAGLGADQGPSLLFVTMPIAFGGMPAGVLFGGLFFFLIAIAGLTTSIGMLEPVVSWLEEKRGLTRPVIAVICGIVIWTLGVGAALSFNVLSGFHPLNFIGVFERKTLFDITEYTVANILIPISGLLIAVFAGWRLTKPSAQQELSMTGSAFQAWRFIMRFVAPLGIGAIFLANFIG